MKHFVVFGQGRTGSTLLIKLLQSHPQVQCDLGNGELLNRALWRKGRRRYLRHLAFHVPTPYIHWKARRRTRPVYGFKLLYRQVASPRRALAALHRQGWQIVHIQRRVLAGLPVIQVTYEANLLNEVERNQICGTIFQALGIASRPVYTSKKKSWSLPYCELIVNYDELQALMETETGRALEAEWEIFLSSADMTRRITAAICTYNRAEVLPEAIESLLKQHLPPADFEILVVDNGSTDATPAVAERCLAAAAPVSARLGIEHRLGIAHARNLAVQMAKGDVVAFLDDDAMASPEWLAALLDAYAAYPDALCVGGKVLLQWQAPRPEWLTDDLLIELSMLDIGKATRVLARNEHIWGTNCSFRRKAIVEAGGFRPELGRRGELLIGQEETELQARLRCHGQVVYTPHATVYHLVPPSRLRQRVFVRRAYGTGRSRALRDATTLPTATQWKVAAALTVAAAKGSLRMLAQFGNAAARLRCTRGNALMLGYWQEIFRRRSAARRTDYVRTHQ